MSLIAGGIISYFVLSALLNVIFPDGSGGCMALIGAVLGAMLIAIATDRLLKKSWPSGRTLKFDSTDLVLVDTRKRHAGETRMAWDQRINVTAWRFTVKRGSMRIPKGWILLALQLVQDESQITLYAFASPKDADEDIFKSFIQLIPRRLMESGDMPLREVNQNKRLLRAEQERWIDGAELTKDDFTLLVDTLSKHVPNWSQA